MFETVDEEEYGKIVSNRRKKEDFVVDDDGLGYYDDGEEHLGVVKDAYEAKQALLHDAEEDDSKRLKKKAKYMQSNTMYSYAKSTDMFQAKANYGAASGMLMFCFVSYFDFTAISCMFCFLRFV